MSPLSRFILKNTTTVKGNIFHCWESDLNNQRHKAVLRRFSKLLLSISIFLWIVLAPAYIFQPDFCAAVTFWPVWLWAISGIILSLIAVGVNIKARLIVTLVWVVSVGFVAEEPQSLLRGIFFNRECKNVCTNGNCLRVISLNCAGGNIVAAEEISPYSPDIIFLQESPLAKDLEILTKKLFSDGGEFVLEGDTAILARGHVIKAEIRQDKWAFMMVGARVHLPSGIEIEATSVHLPSPATGTNLLSLDCWREHLEDRRLRLQRVAVINEHLKPIPDNVPLVVGGDFNAKPWTGASKILSLRLEDTFRQSGFGWPGTGPANFPLWRIDQIWASRHFKTVKVYGVTSKQSDHRMVICDLCKL
jgi:hypothetical protein